MKIFAHTLFKNEEKWLWYSVTSVIGYVDRLLLWDTGSSDNSFKIAEVLKKVYPDKVILREYGNITQKSFTLARQRMLDETESDWVMVVDGDEIWWEESIRKAVDLVREKADGLESVVVPTINLVGDIYHHQEERAGRYKLAGKFGHYNLRFVNRKIPGLKSQNPHGTWGWTDGQGRMIQDRDQEKIGFIDAPYLHASFLPRSASREGDLSVVKRAKKLKYEIGMSFPKDYYYPEVFFLPRPKIIACPWQKMGEVYKFRAFIQTPLKKLKRRLIYGKSGY